MVGIALVSMDGTTECSADGALLDAIVGTSLTAITNDGATLEVTVGKSLE